MATCRWQKFSGASSRRTLVQASERVVLRVDTVEENIALELAVTESDEDRAARE